jgi:hypothetical protein
LNSFFHSIIFSFFKFYLHTFNSEFIQKPELKINNNKGCWSRTITKNNKESYSDIWIPNMDVLKKERKNINSIISKSEETMELFIKDSLIMKKEVNLLNIFESIPELQKMTIIKTNKLFIYKDTGELMSLSK